MPRITERIVAVNEANKNALEAGRDSEITPTNWITQITAIIKMKKSPDVASVEIHWKILRRSRVSEISGVGK